MNECFQRNLSLVTRRRYAMARQASAATREDVFERAVNPNSEVEFLHWRSAAVPSLSDLENTTLINEV
jgi:hypothetical protein